MKVLVREQYPPIQLCRAGAIYRAGDEADVAEELGASWHRSGWVEIIEVDIAEPDLSPLAHSVEHLEDAAGELEQAAGAAAQPGGFRSGSAVPPK